MRPIIEWTEVEVCKGKTEPRAMTMLNVDKYLEVLRIFLSTKLLLDLLRLFQTMANRHDIVSISVFCVGCQVI